MYIFFFIYTPRIPSRGGGTRHVECNRWEKQLRIKKNKWEKKNKIKKKQTGMGKEQLFLSCLFISSFVFLFFLFFCVFSPLFRSFLQFSIVLVCCVEKSHHTIDLNRCGNIPNDNNRDTHAHTKIRFRGVAVLGVGSGCISVHLKKSVQVATV